MKKELKIKEPIKIRTKQLSNHCQSIYLDSYINGKRRYEFLKLYIIPEHSQADKKRNVETLKLVNAIKSQRIIELQNNSYGFYYNHSKAAILLTEYIRYIACKDVGKEARKASMNALINHLQQYDKAGISLKNLDKQYIVDFVEYMKTAIQKHCKKEKCISINTQAYYFKALNYCLNYAVTEDILSVNPIQKMKKEEKPQKRKTEREYLTMDEIKRLVHTDFHNQMLKQAFLFSCFCGLRHCDIVTLTWGNILKHEDGHAQLHIIQQKTQELLSIPLSREAMKQLPLRGEAPDRNKIFENLISLGRTNEILPKWAEKAGISKHVTFHTARHTHATMMITLGADLYTVSKLLGHTNIQTTQIYANIVDKCKKNAIDLIPDIS